MWRWIPSKTQDISHRQQLAAITESSDQLHRDRQHPLVLLPRGIRPQQQQQQARTPGRPLGPREQALSQQALNDDLPDGLAPLAGGRHDLLAGDHLGEHCRRIVSRDDEQAAEDQREQHQAD